VLFRQIRIGRDGEPFTLVKMRTMEVDAEARLSELRHRNERHGPLFKVSSDPRITPVGSVLRATAIDELPQLINVLTGRHEHRRALAPPSRRRSPSSTTS
jgi:lipopolysaccharide/colanic/teichoic acid biosynthesis glycosyltransferase